MKTTVSYLVAAVLLAVATLAFIPPGIGCTGKAARDDVLAPAVASSSVGFEWDVRAGIATLPAAEQEAANDAADDFFLAVRSEDRARMLFDAVPLWPSVKAWALAGINAKVAARSISDGVAESLRERVNQMERGLNKVVERQDE